MDTGVTGVGYGGFIIGFRIRDAGKAEHDTQVNEDAYRHVNEAKLSCNY